MDGNRSVFRVYFPTECLRENSSLAVGCIDQAKRTCCITGLVRSRYLSATGTSGDVCLVAVWINSSEAVQNDSTYPDELHSNDGPKNNILLCIEKSRDCLSVRWCPTVSYTIGEHSTEFVLVLYESVSFLASTTLNEIIKNDSAVSNNSTNTEIILGSLSKQQRFVANLGCKERSEFHDPALPRKTIVRFAADIAIMLPNFVITCIILKISLWLSNSRFFRIPIVKTVLKMPSTLTQIQLQFGSSLLEDAALSKEDQLHQPGSVRFENSKYRLLLDVILGVCLMTWLWSNDFFGTYADRFITWAEMVAVEFESLLNWLMGVPAGLKLNEPLAHFLGNFFLYHIFLWKAYLRTLQPFWSDICYYSCLSGCLGLTVQLSLLQDLISMMTVHIYCFYVYAARLYSLQVLALSSLWRLFCGKKWNVLRKRVDSASYDIDQLFAGTLLFTVLLFTLPTTALFYVVFALLRLMVLSLQGVLITLVSLMNRVPVYWLLLRIVHPAAVTGHVHMSIVQHNPLCIHLELKPLSALELFKMSGKMASDVASNSTWSCLGKKLLLGHLIYPWIEPTDSK